MSKKGIKIIGLIALMITLLSIIVIPASAAGYVSSAYTSKPLTSVNNGDGFFGYNISSFITVSGSAEVVNTYRYKYVQAYLQKGSTSQYISGATSDLCSVSNGSFGTAEAIRCGFSAFNY